MTTKNIITCDKCGNQELTTAAGIWLHVDPRASTKTLVGLTYDQKVAMLNTLDEGDFCSLLCLGEWALARHNLKSFDAEIGGEAE